MRTATSGRLVPPQAPEGTLLPPRPRRGPPWGPPGGASGVHPDSGSRNRGQLLIQLVILALAILLLDLTPGDQAVTAVMRRAETHRAAQEYGAAIEAYRQAASLAPTWPQPWQRQGEILLRQQRFGLAAEAFAQAEARGGGVAAVLGRGETQAARGDWAAALSTWLRARALAPRSASVQLALARAALAQRQFDTAADYGRAALAAEPAAPAQDAAAHDLLGCLAAGDDPALAAEHFELAGDTDMLAVLDAVASEPDAARRPLLLGIAFLQRSELALARRELERAAALAPAGAEAHAYLGHVLDLSGETILARTVLQQALALDPHNSLASYFLGLHFRRLGNPGEALRVLWSGLLLEPDNPALRLEMGATYVDLHDYAAAEEWYEGALDRAPETQKAEFQLALAHFYVDHLYRIANAGIPAAEEAVALAPADADAEDVRGWAYYLAGRLPEAEQALSAALALDPQLVSAHYHLGSLYATTNRKDLARRHLQRASDLDTGSYYRERADTLLADLN